MDNEKVRTYNKFRQRVLEQFTGSKNIEYLTEFFKSKLPSGKLLDYIIENLEKDVRNFKEADTILDSDVIARRGFSTGATDMWKEICRLNTAFYANRIKFVKEYAHIITDESGDNQETDNEDYAMRMFIADSLRPPGLSNLNGPGPLHEIKENQRMTKHEIVTTNNEFKWMDTVPKKCNYNVIKKQQIPTAQRDFMEPEDDEPWSNGNANRTVEGAISEYYGEQNVATDVKISKTLLGNTELGGKQYGKINNEGPKWQDTGSSRFMRYEKIPFWQYFRSRPYESDITETLSNGKMLEGDGQVRRWDMDRLRNNLGETYRTKGNLN
jgi:hypothetical protein